MKEETEFHKYFPLAKMTYLHTLKNKKPKTTREIINIIPSPVPTILEQLFKYRRSRYLRHIGGNDDTWVITDHGYRHYKYLVERLEAEFDGFEGLNAWIERKRAINKIEKEKQDAEDIRKRKEYLENRKRSDEKWKKKLVESRKKKENK